MNAQQKTGRRILLVHFALILAFSLFEMGVLLAYKLLEHLPVQAIRMILTVALFVWAYRGSEWGKNILFVLAGAGAAVILLKVFTSNNPADLSMFVVLAIIVLSLAVVLVASPSVQAFLRHQREVRAGT